MNHIDYISKINELALQLAVHIRGLGGGDLAVPAVQEAIDLLDKISNLSISRALPETIHVPPKMTVMELIELMGKHHLSFTVQPTEFTSEEEEDQPVDFSGKSNLRLWDIVALPEDKELTTTPGGLTYPMAVVACLSPIVLVSQDARRRWNHLCFDVNDLIPVGQAADTIKQSISTCLTDEERTSTVTVLKRD